MAKEKNIGIQAKAVLRPYLSLNRSKYHDKLSGDTKTRGGRNRIYSVAKFRKMSSALKVAGEYFKDNHQLTRLKHITVEMANEYLHTRAFLGVSDKQLSADRLAIEYITGPGTLEKVKGMKHEKENKAYTRAQVELMQLRMGAKNHLRTEISYAAGTRASELLTLRRIDEDKPSEHRSSKWLPDRFIGREGVRYIVTGKNGLKREILLPHDVARELEFWRLPKPLIVTDLEIIYEVYYDLGGGNAFSSAISRASNKTLGWSNGAHGLRHSYVENRMKELTTMGYTYSRARTVIAQEVGHFREDITEVYLR